jgi:uncharacterized membrane protein
VSEHDFIDATGRALEGLGVFVLAVGVVAAMARFTVRRAKGARGRSNYARLRADLGRAILVGLEILVAADIVVTVTIDRTLESVGVLGLIVAVRTFLSFSLEVEIDRAWPWQRARNSDDADPKI